MKKLFAAIACVVALCAAQARALGVRATVSEQDLSHLEVNEALGLPGAYTDAVQAFFDSVGLDLR